MTPKCSRCGADADFQFQNPKEGIAPTDYCFQCFEIDHPDKMEEAQEGQKIATELFHKKSLS